MSKVFHHLLAYTETIFYQIQNELECYLIHRQRLANSKITLIS